jgi:uncharacterized protein (TIGR02246 family)
MPQTRAVTATTLKFPLTGFCLALLLGSGTTVVGQVTPSANAPTSDDASVRAIVAATWRDHIDAAVRKDLTAVMDIYADDVFYVVAGIHEVRGRQAVEAMELQTLEGADVLNAVHTIQALSVFGDVAYEIGTVTGPIRQKGQATAVVTFNFMAMWRRQADGLWRIQHMVGEPE